MKNMKIMPLSTQGSKQHLPKLFLKVNEKKTSFWIFMLICYACILFVCGCGND